MFKKMLLIVFFTVIPLSLAAQEGSPATVISVEKDRTGHRFANRWQVRCDSTGQVWTTGELNSRTRKMYVHAGDADLRVGTAAPPNSIGAILNGTNVTGWSTLGAKQGHNYGTPARLTIICTGPSQFYAHAEWHRSQTSLFDLL